MGETMIILRKLLTYYIYMVSLFFVGRVTLFVIYFDRIRESNVNHWLSFLHGLRMDTITACCMLLIPTAILLLTPRPASKVMNTVLRIYFLAMFIFILFMEQATHPFLAEYDVRPNYLFLEYLAYPREVFSMLWADYPVLLIITAVGLTAFSWIFLRLTRQAFVPALEVSTIKKAALLLPVMLVLALGIRSSFGHRPANNSDAMYSSSRLVNEITKNSIYNVAYAAYAQVKFEESAKAYGEMDPAEALERVKSRLNIAGGHDLSPLARREESHFRADEPKNLVIFLQESLGAQFVEALGGEPGVTPNLNRLSREGILFTELHSTGTRSVRGIAAMVSGNYSVPGIGVLKRNKAQNDYFTLSSLLEPHGYHTMFLYGGESRFDNMRGWFLGNGFDEVIDEPKFKDPVFTGTWGVSDEDVVRRAHQEFKSLHERNQKFAAVIFSTSNHTPFDFPDGRIELIEGLKKKSEKNAIKYADHAIGELVRLAREEEYYKDTVFVIVADHNVKVRGAGRVPVNMFRIPAVILGGDTAPKRFDQISSQPDVLATALDLMGLDLTYPIMGHSIFSENKQPIALMQFYSSYALRVADKVAILRPEKNPETFLLENRKLVSTASDPELERDVLAFVTALDHLYQNRLYRLPPEDDLSDESTGD